MPSLIQLHAIFKGKVQGIGFRWTVVDYAERHKLVGTTKNLPDGTVEVYAVGPRGALEAFVEALKQDKTGAHIVDVACNYEEAKTHYDDFRIIY